MRRTLSGAKRAAIGSTLLRVPGCHRRVQYTQREHSVRLPCGLRQALKAVRKALLLWAWRAVAGSHRTTLPSDVPFTTQ